MVEMKKIEEKQQFNKIRTTSDSHWRIAWRTLRRKPAGMIGLTGFLLLILLVILASVLAPMDPTELDYDHPMEPPSRIHLFGTDDLGRDILSRVLWGGRESLRVAIISVIISALGGVAIGLISGFYGGWVDSLIMRLVDVLLAFPSILLLLSIVAALGPSLGTILIALGIANIPWNARFIRGAVLSAKNNEYVTAAQVIGAKNRRIMYLHILPNIMAPFIVYSTLCLGGAIMTTAGLSYIGLGAQPPSPEWGAMLNSGRTYMRNAWWMSVFPGAAIFVAVLSINLLGDGLRDALDPKLRI
ncbi:MAG: ABC transporter permease [Anaerolineales bacterium]|nr:ABC transporter permease [Anaerolineales bacterium]